MYSIKNIAVYCGSSSGNKPIYTERAFELGAAMAKKNIGVVFGAGSVGLMNKLADGAMSEGGVTIGVIPQFLMDWEVGRTDLTELIITENMHERKKILADRSDAFIILPGGFGTMEEFFEVLTWRQLHLHQKPIAILNVNGYYNAIKTLFDTMSDEGLLKPDNKEMVIFSESVDDILAQLQAYQPTASEKWVE